MMSSIETVAHSGAPRLLLADDGWLTAWRTAAAAALAAPALAPERITEVGIAGTGLQASLAIEWLPETLGPAALGAVGRDIEKARRLAAASDGRVRVVAGIDELLRSCNVIVTATPAQAPLFAADLVNPGTHLVGVGADGPGKGVCIHRPHGVDSRRLAAESTPHRTRNG